ncbi:alpha/beta hydrolase domain-containing protein 17B-like [Bacillus rossius redtenbacheri]|uniref:alpha/beta hydrolase domain-containing protein 17B-like n=1 Tax=Bacillus rossius redtenbacheri TaxID=93214 RepID=UPI002FDD5A24
MSLLWLFCCPPLPSSIVRKLAFHPPAPTYRVEQTSVGLRFVPRVLVDSVQLWRVQPFFVPTRCGSQLACVYLRCAVAPRFTLLMSQGNSEDLGLVVGWYLKLGCYLGCDVVGYDYSGYGASSGRPSERGMYADATAVWHALVDRHHVPPEKVVLYGYSLGTAPTIHLAARHKSVAGVVLQAPFTSALRLVCPGVRRTWCCDAFNNIDRVGEVHAPVLVVHGIRDDVVEWRHGIEILSRCANPVEPLWLEGGDHYNLSRHEQLWARLGSFLAELEAASPSLGPSSADERRSSAPSTTVPV